VFCVEENTRVELHKNIAVVNSRKAEHKHRIGIAEAGEKLSIDEEGGMAMHAALGDPRQAL